MAELGRLSGTTRGSSGFPARLRSALTSRGWGTKPEPRVRFGQPFLPGIAALGPQHAEQARPLLDQAEALVARRFTYLGRTLEFPERVDWNAVAQPVAWQVSLNGLDGLFACGVAAALEPTPAGRFGWYERAMRFIREWTEDARPGRGVAWSVPALALRIPNLIYFHAMFAAEIRSDQRARRLLLETLDAQATALAEGIPTQAVDTWLIAAGRALFMAGRFFDGLEARAWLESGNAILWTQLREQVHDDGGHQSRNPALHAFVLAQYLEVAALLRTTNDDLPPWGRKRVKGMADFLSRLLHPDGGLPLFHGATNDVAPAIDEVLAAAAVLLHEPGIALPGELPGVWPLLLLGDSARRVYASLSRRGPTTEARALRRTGYYLLPGQPGDVMILDGASPPAAGHAAVFGYELSVAGMRMIVDSGGGDTEDASWARHFRGARAHSVLVGSRRPVGPAMPSASAETHWAVRDGLVSFSGTHDGVVPGGAELRCRRRIFCLPGRFWVVCDEVSGSGEEDVESLIHFHPDVTLHASCNGRPVFVARRSDEARLKLVFAGAGTVRVERGVEGPERQGWYAARHGERRPASVVALAASGPLPMVLAYALLPRVNEPAEMALEHDAFQLRVTLRVGDVEHVLTAVQDDVELHSTAS